MLDQGGEYILFATNILVDLIDKFTKQIPYGGEEVRISRVSINSNL